MIGRPSWQRQQRCTHKHTNSSTVEQHSTHQASEVPKREQGFPARCDLLRNHQAAQLAQSSEGARESATSALSHYERPQSCELEQRSRECIASRRCAALHVERQLSERRQLQQLLKAARHMALAVERAQAGQRGKFGQRLARMLHRQLQVSQLACGQAWWVWAALGLGSALFQRELSWQQMFGSP